MVIRVTILLISALYCASYAQVPGSWKKETLCTSCYEPGAIDYFDKMNGIIVCERPTDTVGNVYRTTDGGVSWQLINSVPGILGARKRNQNPNTLKYFESGNVSIFNKGRGMMVYSVDSLTTWSVAEAPGTFDDIAVCLSDPSTIFRLSRSVQQYFRTKLLVSYDTGYFFEGRTDLVLDSNHAPGNGIFLDSCDIWMTAVVIVTAYDTSLRVKLFHTTDCGAQWSEAYPYDTLQGLSMRYSYFGNNGMVMGANRGTLYFLDNFYRHGSQDQRISDLLFTTDNGATWKADSTNLSEGTRGNTRLLSNPSGTVLWSVFQDRKTIAYSPDNGNTWYYDSTTFRNDSISIMHWEDSSQGYILTFKDSVFNLYTYIPPAGIEHQPNFNSKLYFTVYPTLVAGSTLSVHAVQPIQGTFEVYDVLGRYHMSRAIRLDAKASAVLNIGDLASGIYLITLRMGSEVITARFVKQ